MSAIYYVFFEDHRFLKVEEWQLTSQLQEESPFEMPDARKLNIHEKGIIL